MNKTPKNLLNIKPQHFLSNATKKFRGFTNICFPWIFKPSEPFLFEGKDTNYTRDKRVTEID